MSDSMGVFHMNADKPNTAGKSKSDPPSSASTTPTPASSQPSASSPSSAQSDPAVAIAAIEAIKRLALRATGDTTEAIAAIEALGASSPNAKTAAVEAITSLGQSTGKANGGGVRPKRAICLAGGGPAAGLHIGVLEGLKERGITFDDENSVWALSCIGAWVGIVYNQAKKGEGLSAINKFFRDVFRDDESFRSFPTNTIFSPDWFGYLDALQDFVCRPESYRNAFVPRKMMESLLYSLSLLADRKNWKTNFSEGDFNRWTLNHVLAVHPAARFLTALIFKSKINGRTKLYYPDSKFLRDINFESLKETGKPYIFHNAWNLTRQELQLFSNRNPPTHHRYKRITPASLCACSALPLIEQTVEIEGDIYCEGALVDTVNFEELIEDHPDLDEIWISRIVDASQILPPKNILDSTANLCELFAATVGEDDVKLFKYHVKDAILKTTGRKWTGTIIEIQVERNINFEWSHTNLENGCHKGREAVDKAYTRYKEKIGGKQEGELLIIEPTPAEKAARKKARRDRFIAVEQLRPWLHADREY
jgi:predicted acylesterase/phospholipase RssA